MVVMIPLEPLDSMMTTMIGEFEFIANLLCFGVSICFLFSKNYSDEDDDDFDATNDSAANTSSLTKTDTEKKKGKWNLRK
jgi:hypothetical protein